MTSKDKTGDQLLASIRKSKSGTVASKTATLPAESTAEGKPRPTTSARAPVARAAPERQRSETQSQDNSHDNYSVGRRVWPD